MKTLARVLKYELLNVARNRWIYAYAALLAAVTFTFIKISGDPGKALVTLSSITSTLVPLVTVLFTSFYWYNSDRFTELLLTQPLRRRTVFLARITAIISSLSGGYVAGLGFPFVLSGELSTGLLLLVGTGLFLTIVFTLLGMLVAVNVLDRMRGVGVAFALWFYFALVHDGLILVMLLVFRDYPLDIPAALLGSLNPVGLSRVVLLMHYDASLLLGHTGALIRDLLTGNLGLTAAFFLAWAWIQFPVQLGLKTFERKDF